MWLPNPHLPLFLTKSRFEQSSLASISLSGTQSHSRLRIVWRSDARAISSCLAWRKTSECSIETYDLVSAAADQNRRIEPAAEWLLDNFYLVEEQIRAIRRLLPPSYSRELPRLESGSATSFPRVYGIALELIAHVDGRVDAASLNGFVSSYQSVQPLRLGELSALPLMLRLALIENSAARRGSNRRGAS